MKPPAERYREDPWFHHLVDLFYAQFVSADQSGAGLTPTEVREASGFAWQMYIERHPSPLLIRRPPEDPLPPYRERYRE